MFVSGWTVIDLGVLSLCQVYYSYTYIRMENSPVGFKLYANGNDHYGELYCKNIISLSIMLP